MIVCDSNFIKELVIPEGVRWMSCENNLIQELTLPRKINWIFCDIMDGIEEQHKKNLHIHIYQKR